MQHEVIDLSQITVDFSFILHNLIEKGKNTNNDAIFFMDGNS